MAPRPLLTLGTLLITPGAEATFPEEWLKGCLKRHVLGDWGDVSAEDKAENDAANPASGYVLSAYLLHDDRLWIVSEGSHRDRVTTLLLPEER